MVRASYFEPVLTNYSSLVYNAALQNWAIAQGDNGEMYFGNGEGVLTYDGYWWTKHPLPGHAVARSLLYAGNRLYVGAYEEFGYMERRADGTMAYTSLWALLKNYTAHNDEIWNIIETPDKHIIFQSFCSWFEYDGQTVTAHYNPAWLPLYFFSVRGNIYVQEVGQGFGILENGRYRKLIDRAQLGGSSVVCAMPFGQKSMLLVTEFNGLSVFDGKQLKTLRTNVDALLKRAQVNRATMIAADSTIVLGTIHDGIYGISPQGQLKWHYNMQHLLANNTVLRLFSDRDNNVWAALDAGLALIHSGAPYCLMTDSESPFGMVYDVFSIPTGLYIATNQATWLYHAAGKEMITGTEGQNWHLTGFGNQLIVGNNHGTKVIRGVRAAQLPGSSVASSTGVRRYLVNDTHDYLIESSYAELRVYRNIDGQWTFRNNIQGFQAPVQQFEIAHNGVLWAAHMSRGLYRLELSGDMKRVVHQKYFPALDNQQVGRFVHIAKIRGEIVFAAGERLYVYNGKEFIRYKELEGIFPGQLVSVTTVDNQRFWVSTDKGYALVRFQQGKYRLENYIPAAFFGLECGRNTNNVRIFGNDAYFCLNGGIGRIAMSSLPMRSNKHPLALVLSSASYVTEENQRIEMPLQGENIRSGGDVTLRYSYPNYTNTPLKFYFHVKGGGRRQTLQSSSPRLTLNSLKYGNYTVRAEVRSVGGQVLSVHEYAFVYPRPFFLSIPMLLLYILLLCYLIWFYVRRTTAKAVRREQQMMEAENMRQQLEMAQQQRIIEEQQRQLLQKQIQEQGRDIVALSMNAVKTTKNEDDEAYWNLYQENFDLIHKQFFRHLRQQYPSLTSTDLKFCAFLRLNLSTKDIARFTGLTVRGVEGARHRLRKKLQIPEDRSLTEFLIDFK